MTEEMIIRLEKCVKGFAASVNAFGVVSAKTLQTLAEIKYTESSVRNGGPEEFSITDIYATTAEITSEMFEFQKFIHGLKL